MIDEIKRNMRAKGLNNADLARRLPPNIREKDLSQIMSGKRKPSTAILETIAQAMGLEWKLAKRSGKTTKKHKNHDRGAIRIVNKSNAGFDAEYWADKTPLERLSALELLRKQMTIVNGIEQRLQRVYSVIKRT